MLKINFYTTGMDYNNLPNLNWVEIAIWGRSNVGKSSLINGLGNNKQLAKTSNSPGRTRGLNFFNINDSLCLVDLPGYGYAIAPHKEIKHWNRLITAYLTNRPNLRKIYLLIDSRHGLKTIDMEKMKFLDTVGLPYKIVLTKADKVKSTETNLLVESIMPIIAKSPAAANEIVITSYKDKIGFDLLKQDILECGNNLPGIA